MGGVLRVRITPDDVGRRVTVRARIPAEPGAPGHTDTIGMLRAWDDGVLTIERRNGALVEIAAEDVVGARVVGPPPTRRRGTDDHRPRG